MAGWAVFAGPASARQVGTRANDSGVASSGSPPTMQRPDPGMATVLNPRRSASAFQAGVTVLAFGNDPDFAAKSRAVLDRIASLGADTVRLDFPLIQSSWTSTDVHSDTAQTPSDTMIATFVREAHRRGFTVMLRPLLDEATLQPAGKWRGTISPSDANAWFANYGAAINRYASLAQANHVEIFDIGTELVSLEGATSQWSALVGSVRGVYHGQVTYSANWSQPFVGFASALDFVGIDAFFPLDAPTDASADQLGRAWQQWLPQLDQVGRRAGKPVVVTELGTTSETASFREPWVWKHDTGLSLDAQTRYYAASCRALKSRVGGIYWWDFLLDPPTTPSTDPGFVPEGKPAELQIASCSR